MNDQYEVCLDGRTFYVTEEMLPEYLNVPNIVIYKIKRELFIYNGPKISEPPTVSSTSPENP